MPTITAEEFESNLAHFTGTEGYARMKYPGVNLLLTDGAAYLCENAKSYWLLDLIASYQVKKLRGCEFQHWVVKTENHTAVVTCDDGDRHILVEQHIGYTDFPLRETHLYVQPTEYPEPGMVVMLTSEY